MNIPMLVVDTDIEVNRREQAVWDNFGIDAVRVDTMCDAVNKLARENFLFTAINADTIHYLPMLKIMDKVSPTPILIITSRFSVYDQVEAIHHGADAYVPFQERVEENIMLALALIARYNERNKRQSKPPNNIPYEKLLVCYDTCQVFCGNEEVPLTKTEFDIFAYLLANRGIFLTYNQIYSAVWGNGYDDSPHGALHNHMIRMRKKLTLATGGDGYLENKRSVGYRLPSYNGK